MSAPAKGNDIDPLLHPAGRQAPRRLDVLAGQEPAKRHRAALHQDWPCSAVRSVGSARIHSQPAARVDE